VTHVASRCLGSKVLLLAWTTAYGCRGQAPHGRAEAPDYAGRRRLKLRFAEQGQQLFFRALGIFAGGFTVEAVAAVTMGFFCFSVATIGTLEAWSRECDENDGLDGFGQKSLRHTQLPIVRDPSEPTSPALVRLASA
jgi:hypothetical protein